MICKNIIYRNFLIRFIIIKNQPNQVLEFVVDGTLYQVPF